MPMRPEDIEALLAQLGPGGGQNPLAGAIGKYSGQQPGLGGQMLGPGAMPQSAPAMPPAMAPAMAPAPAQGPPTDEAMLDQVQQGMGGGGEFELSGDVETDRDALQELYDSGDPNDPAVQERWERARQDFIDMYGSDQLPAGLAQGEAEGGTQYAREDDERDQQSSSEYENLRKRNRSRTIG